MIQLILDVEGEYIELPESEKKYAVNEEVLYSDQTMISGRLTREIRGSVWNISYQYGYFTETDREALLRVLKKGVRQPISCAFARPDDSTELEISEFFVTSISWPRYVFSRNGIPVWLDISFSLREVNPHD